MIGSLPAGSTATTIQLWPEHFDAATAVTLPSTETGNLGFSPGESYESEPYVYVGPWSAARPGDPGFWNAPFGAVRRRSELVDLPDPTAACRELVEKGLDLALVGGRGPLNRRRRLGLAPLPGRNRRLDAFERRTHVPNRSSPRTTRAARSTTSVLVACDEVPPHEQWLGKGDPAEQHRPRRCVDLEPALVAPRTEKSEHARARRTMPSTETCPPRTTSRVLVLAAKREGRAGWVQLEVRSHVVGVPACRGAHSRELADHDGDHRSVELDHAGAPGDARTRRGPLRVRSGWATQSWIPSRSPW